MIEWNGEEWGFVWGFAVIYEYSLELCDKLKSYVTGTLRQLPMLERFAPEKYLCGVLSLVWRIAFRRRVAILEKFRTQELLFMDGQRRGPIPSVRKRGFDKDRAEERINPPIAVHRKILILNDM